MMAVFLVLAVLLAVAALITLDIRRSGTWDPWDEFDGDQP